MNGGPTWTPRLTGGQEAACARVLYALERPAGVAILCGPAGTGVSTLLHEILRRTRGGEARLARSVDAAQRLLATDGLATLLVDDAHLATAAALGDLVESAEEARHPGLVLGGQGRLLTLLHRAPALDARVQVRAVLQPLTPAETATIAHEFRPAVRWGPDSLRVLHEIAGGIPAGVVRLVELCAVVAAAEPARPIEAADVEAIHVRLTTTAA